MTIYTLYTCDAWKSYSSMNQYWIGTNFKGLIKAIKQGLICNDFEMSGYEGEGTRLKIMHLNELLEDYKHFDCNERLRQILDHIDYAYVSINENNSYC